MDSYRVTEVGVVMSHWCRHLGFGCVVEAAGVHFLGECHEVGWGLKVPLFVSPVCASEADTCLDFINNHEDVEFLCQLSEPVPEVAGDVIVPTFRLNWLDDSGSDLTVLLGPPVLDLEASVG